MVMDFIVEYQAYLYVLLIVLLTVGLYWYIFHLYWSEKTGRRDYEKYANIALNDEVYDNPVETMPTSNEGKLNKQRGAK